ncbi:hypothetical protein BD626DRAFT_496837 [Schizophyllum amplum]|uniref:Uncharacterized protein n=1 Tax=Schizophyllum amplum TaxID=97359 RepID=A0A550CDI9_9AGAR|nr:hypothetical protein BD626DRAFT_496837 [Auriculariopsis ampla]
MSSAWATVLCCLLVVVRYRATHRSRPPLPLSSTPSSPIIVIYIVLYLSLTYHGPTLSFRLSSVLATLWRSDLRSGGSRLVLRFW